jgi:outer membrane biogenesis lipoprotein LolB
MKRLQFVLLACLAFILIGCGAGHPNLTSVQVSPSTATAESATHAQVGYTAKGVFSNGSSRELSQVDGLSWKTSTNAASIGSTGEATCLGPGTVTVTASAPQNLQLTVNNGVTNTSATVQGTAQLVCQ